jgi:hypothetical protein
MYKFNPISDISLFENIENQHFYKRENVENKKTGLYQYIYLFHDAKIIKNKIILSGGTIDNETPLRQFCKLIE